LNNDQIINEIVRNAGQPLGNRMTNIVTKIQCPCFNIEKSDQIRSNNNAREMKNCAPVEKPAIKPS
jgi:hypothetical protein